MKQQITALLVHNNENEAAFRTLESALKKLGIGIRCVRSCGDASALLTPTDAPQLVFADIELPDGTWVDVLNLAAGQTRNSAKVVVVSPVVDDRLYLNALESGAYDFIVPPVRAGDVAHIVCSATSDWVKRLSPSDAAGARAPQRHVSARYACGARMSSD
ncbi:MAG: response regulator [Terriglobia bacterium]